MLSLISVSQFLYLKFQNFLEQEDKYLPRENQHLKSNKTKPYLIGLTGSIASGKSTVREILGKLGYGTLDCDKLGHKCYEKGTPAYFKLIETFGEDILDENKQVNRKILGQKVFQKPTELKKLTDIVWPEIGNLILKEIDVLFKEHNKQIIFVEAALLIEANWHKNMNEVWICWLPEDEAIKRATLRDKVDEEQVKLRMKNQISNEERLKLANVVINTVEAPELVENQIKIICSMLEERLNNENQSI